MADEWSKPIYSYGKADRFAVNGEMIQIPHYVPGPGFYAPENIYDKDNKYNKNKLDPGLPDVTKYKFKTDSKWRIGTAKRRPLNDKEKFSYYNHVYRQNEDLGALPKKWNKITGGAMPKEARVKYALRENTPGPGRYTPSIKLTRPRSANYFIAERTQKDILINKTGTTKEVGPGKYRAESAKYTSIHRDFPEYSIGRGKRPPLYPRPWTKKETYWIYSSMGNQVQSKKKTEEQVKIGKSTRAREGLRGTFKCMMDRVPTQVRIPMPKF